MKVRCYCNLYVSSSLEEKKNKVIQDLMDRKLFPSVYVVTLAQGEQNHLEFFPSPMLRQHLYDDWELFVVGIADSYEAAEELVEVIAQDTLDQTGGTGIRTFIQENQESFEESRG